MVLVVRDSVVVVVVSSSVILVLVSVVVGDDYCVNYDIFLL